MKSTLIMTAVVAAFAGVCASVQALPIPITQDLFNSANGEHCR
jgi:hypothetical protein